jgi:hypothetical protein
MAVPTDNETWMIEEGDRIIQKAVFAMETDALGQKYCNQFEAVGDEMLRAQPGRSRDNGCR